MGIMLGAITFSAFVIGNQTSVDVGRTMAFAVLSFSELIHAFNLRSREESLFSLHLWTNKWLFGAAAAGILLTFTIMEIGILRDLFRLTTLSIANWGFVCLFSFMPIIVEEIIKIFRRLRARK